MKPRVRRASKEACSNARELFSLRGKVAIITGGALNLGYDMALGLAEAGADIVITSRTLAKAQETARKIKANCRVGTLALEMNHCNWDEVEGMAKKAHAWKGHIDVLVNNAGGRTEKMEGNLFKRPPECIVEMIHANLIGPLLCCKAVGHLMMEQGSGKIINIASIAGLVGRDRRIYERNNKGEQPVDYAVAKAGIIGMTRDLAGLMSPYGVCVNAISPGGFDKGDCPDGFIKDYSNLTMLGHMGRMGLDIKGAAIFLAAPASDYVTGQNIVVDGGFTLWK